MNVPRLIPTLSYNIKDTSGNILLEFPLNTLLDKITDEWSLIMNYYENYYPIVIGVNIDGYRPITYEECKTDKFIKLFIMSYKKNRIKYTSDDYWVCVEKHPLRIKGNAKNIFTDIIRKQLIHWTWNHKNNVIGDIDNIYVSETRIGHNDGGISILEDLVF